MVGKWNKMQFHKAKYHALHRDRNNRLCKFWVRDYIQWGRSAEKYLDNSISQKLLRETQKIYWDVWTKDLERLLHQLFLFQRFYQISLLISTLFTQNQTCHLPVSAVFPERSYHRTHLLHIKATSLSSTGCWTCERS